MHDHRQECCQTNNKYGEERKLKEKRHSNHSSRCFLSVYRMFSFLKRGNIIACKPYHVSYVLYKYVILIVINLLKGVDQ